MGQPGTREVEHRIEVRAPAEVVYGFVAEVANWPQIFPPSVHVEHLERGEREERIQIWATANGEAKTWTSRRALDPDSLRVEFRQEVSQPPVASMGGAWIIEALADGGSRVRLLHDYRAVDDDADKLAWIDRAVDRNSRSELAAMKANAELAAGSSELLLTFDDTVRVDGSAKDVYDFLDQAQKWEQRLPHVARVSLVEDTPGLQWLEMDTRTKDGSVHTTKSVRVCFPHHKIVYKQVVLPALMTLHTGSWLLEEDSDGVSVTSRHTVAINEANIAGVLGPDAGVAEARAFVRTALSTNSLATLGYAKEYAEARR
ncbi:aromatase/cyclase [Saccharothrix variisporea]|uniref:Aromatase n=1 Tax=Saccharothrix variisporea TaxID=543527 RepID=A0A495XP89_9PSEU|nr:aromatase/cyclase [Saccharothrix variisporea]RKT74696.1 aromatase [Saccharothrix variisporea]